MDTKWKIAVPVIVAVIIVALVLMFLPMPPREAPLSAPGTPEGAGVTPPTGNPDDAVAAILQGAVDDATILNEEEGDAVLLDAENGVLNEFGQSINDNDF